MGQHAYKTLTMPKNRRFMPKIARNTPNFARTYFEVYTSPSVQVPNNNNAVSIHIFPHLSDS